MKKINSIWMRVLVIVISVAMMIGCLGGIVLADGEGSTSTAGVSLHTRGNIPSKVALGDTFSIPDANTGVTVTVKSPDGKKMEAPYTASILGNYTVTYSDDNVSYTYNINCYEDAEYFVFVENNGASIPSYIKQGGSFKLPEWSLAKYDEDGNLVKVEATTSWTLTEASRTEVAGADVTMETLGNQIVTLNAKLNSDKVYSQEYTVSVQSNFADEKAPVIRNIANMPSSASVNTEVTLPKAVAEDNYDENVLIEVSVKDPAGNAVKQVEVNDYNFAIDELEEEVAFDNDRVTSFYPTKTGTYVVTYTATDDAGNTSTAHSYKITVSDKTGPVIVESEDYAIPTVWGLSSVENAEGVIMTGEDLTINIPLPEVVDNKDKFILNVAGEEAWSGDVKMTVEIANPTLTVARWTSITPADIKDGLTINSEDATYGKYFKDDATGVVIGGEQTALSINFGDFYDETADGTKVKAGVTGNWTVTFSVRDAANNGGYNKSQKVYTINVADIAFVDEKAPEVEAPALPEYIIVGAESDSYIVPSIVASDDKDSRLEEVYTIYNDAEGSLEVKGGEELAIVEETVESEVKYYFENEDEDRIELNGKIYFAYSAMDDAGNVTELKDKDEADYSINIYKAEDGFAAENVVFNFVDAIEAGTAEDQIIGEFTVNSIAQREFVGFELSVKDEEGNSLDNVISYAYFNEEAGVNSLNVKNIKFNPAKAGVYEINVRILDASGNSYVYAKKVVATKDDNHIELGPNVAASAWEEECQTYTSYMLKRTSATVPADDYVRVYKISGGKFSLLGYEFTPMAQGGYGITEFYGKKADVANAAVIETVLTKIASYGMTATDDEKTTFEVNGVIPTYVDKKNTPKNSNQYEEGAYFITAPIMAYSASRSYDVNVTYTDPDGNQYTAKKLYEYVGTETDAAQYTFKAEENYEFFGRFALIFDKDGTYTMVVKSTDANGASSKSYTIKVGDVKAPQFKLDASSVKAKVGDVFAYASFSDVAMGEGETTGNITVTYRLLEPGSSSNEVVAVSGSKKLDKVTANNGVYSIALDNEYKFEKSGDYTVEITLSDEAGNKSVQKYTITVSTATSSTPASLTMLSTILIIVGVLLILGVVYYLIRFRKRRA